MSGGDDAGDPLAVLRRSAHLLNDLGNARRLHDHAGGRLYWIEEEGQWVAFDGVRWSLDDGKASARAWCHAVAAGLMEEFYALSAANDEEVKAVYGQRFSADMREKRCADLYAHAIKSGESAKAEGMMKQAQGLRGGNSGAFLMQAHLPDFDADPLAFHCANGVLRFAKDEAGVWGHSFRPGHSPADMMMQVGGVAYDADAAAPGWAARMDTMFTDPVQREAIQRIYGMVLTGLISDQAFYIYQGKGQDGKSMTNKIIGEMLGDYFRTASPKTFLEGPARGGSEHQSDIVRLKGDVRLVVCDEPKKGGVWDGERIKQATGSKFVARGVNAKKEETFTPRWKLIVECNTLPRAPSDDHGFRRRFKLYPWVVQFGITPGVADEPGYVVETRLRGEASGILNWMIAGALRWLETDEIPEAEMAALARASFWATSSALGDWLESCCDLTDTAALTGAGELYASFKQFCLDRGDKEDAIMKQTGFGNRLNEIQCYSVKDGRTKLKVRMGIKFKAADGAGAADTGDVW